MGGRAFQDDFPTVRVDAADYAELAEMTVALVQDAAGPGRRVVAIPAYRTKASFGDIDILVDKTGLDVAQFREKVQLEIGSPAIKPNGDVVSLLTRAREGYFQVDLLLSPSHEFDFALAYFSYNDLGNLIGRVAHKQGFKYGHDGLWYTFREGNYAFRDLLLTLDVRTAQAFLGYDPDRFAAGFETLVEIFEYAASTPFFNTAIYHLDNRNHRSRVRDRKRKTYMEFLEWLEGPGKALNLPEFEGAEDKADYLPRAFEWFPLFERDYEQAAADLAVSRQVKAKLNGALVMELTGRTGSDIGEVLSALKARHDSHEAYVQWVLSSTTEQLKEAVLAVHAGRS